MLARNELAQAKRLLPDGDGGKRWRLRKRERRVVLLACALCKVLHHSRGSRNELGAAP